MQLETFKCMKCGSEFYGRSHLCEADQGTKLPNSVHLNPWPIQKSNTDIKEKRFAATLAIVQGFLSTPEGISALIELGIEQNRSSPDVAVEMAIPYVDAILIKLGYEVTNDTDT